MAAANRLACLVLCGVWMQVSALSLGARALAGDAMQAPQQHGPGEAPHAGASGSEVAKRLAGVWKAAEDRVPRATALDIQVFGPDAYEVKNVDLTIQSAGEGVLKVSKAVVGQKGRRYSPSVIEAKLVIGSPTTSVTGRIEPAIKVIERGRAVPRRIGRPLVQRRFARDDFDGQPRRQPDGASIRFPEWIRIVRCHDDAAARATGRGQQVTRNCDPFASRGAA